MLDSQRDATFVIVDAPQPACASQATLDLLGNLRGSQKPISPLWIDECVRRGILVDLDQYTIRTFPTAPPMMRQPKEERPTDTGTPYNRGQKPTDIEVPYKHSSVTVALGDIPTLERKRRLSQSEFHLADDVVRPTGIIRKAVDPRVTPRPSAERQASNSELSTTPARSISRPGPATYSPGVFGEKRPLCRSSVYDGPDATTLDLPAKRIDLGAIKDDLHQVTNDPSQVPPRGVNMISDAVRSDKSSCSVAAAETVPSQQPTRTYRPDTPPLPPRPSTSAPDMPLYDLARVSLPGPETSFCSIRVSGLPMSSGEAEEPLDLPPRRGLTTPFSLRPTLALTRSAHDDQMSEMSSSASSDFSTYIPSGDEEASTPNRLGGSSAQSRSYTVPKSTMVKYRVGSVRADLDVQDTRLVSARDPPSVPQAKLGKLVDEMDQWLKTEPHDTPFLFLKALDVKVRPLLNCQWCDS